MQRNNEIKSKQLFCWQDTVCSMQYVVGSEQWAVVKHQSLPTAYCLLKSCSLKTCLLLTIYCLLFTACYEPKEGCLDAGATNFDANADDSCPDCCTYPELKVSFLHKVATSDSTTSPLVYDDPYLIDSTQFFKINQIRFYLSDIQLRRSDGTLEAISDSIDLRIPQIGGDTSDIRVPNAFILVDKDNFQANSLGNFRKSGNFDGIQFQIGVIEAANHADPNQLSDEHPLSFQEVPMHWNTEDGYIFNQISLSQNKLARDSIIIEYGGVDNLQPISLDTPFIISEGFNVTLVIQIDYLKWFEGISLSKDTEASITQHVLDNIAASLSLVEVKLE